MKDRDQRLFETTQGYLYDRRTVIPVLADVYKTLNVSRGHMQESVAVVRGILERTDLSYPTPHNSNILLLGGGSGTPVVGRSLYTIGVPSFSMIVSSGEMGRDLQTGEFLGGGMIYDEIPDAVDGMDTVKQCIFATPDKHKTALHELLNARKDKMSFGYLAFEALRQMTGDPQQAADFLNAWMGNPYRVVPSTTDRTELSFGLGGETISELDYIQRDDQAQFADKIVLTPPASLSPEAKKAIEKAKTIVVGPGDAFFSVLPHWSVSGLGQAIEKNNAANLVFIVNLTWRPFDTHNFKVSDFLDLYGRFLPQGRTITAIVNTGNILGENQVMDDVFGDNYERYRIVRADIASDQINRNKQHVHDEVKLGRVLQDVIGDQI